MYMYISNINLKYVFIHAGGLGSSGNQQEHLVVIKSTKIFIIESTK
jgi:hypothetical protein